jgi:hypothetical protein
MIPNIVFETDSPDKVSTCLLLTRYDNKLNFRKFGNEADHALHVLDKEDTPTLAFKHFKMSLFRGAPTVEAHNGVQVPVMDVITFSLKVFFFFGI